MFLALIRSFFSFGGEIELWKIKNLRFYETGGKENTGET
jgi:hypothetical protein